MRSTHLDLSEHILMAYSAVLVTNQQVRSGVPENVRFRVDPSRNGHHIYVRFCDVESVHDIRAGNVKRYFRADGNGERLRVEHEDLRDVVGFIRAVGKTVQARVVEG